MANARKDMPNQNSYDALDIKRKLRRVSETKKKIKENHRKTLKKIQEEKEFNEKLIAKLEEQKREYTIWYELLEYYEQKNKIKITSKEKSNYSKLILELDCKIQDVNNKIKYDQQYFDDFKQKQKDLYASLVKKQNRLLDLPDQEENEEENNKKEHDEARRDFFHNQKNKYKKYKKLESVGSSQLNPDSTSEHWNDIKSFFSSIWGVVKKGLDVLDDCWMAIAKTLQQAGKINGKLLEVVSGVLTGGPTAVIQGIEAYNGLKQVSEAYELEEFGVTDTRDKVHGWTNYVLGSTGAIAGVTYLTCGILVAAGISTAIPPFATLLPLIAGVSLIGIFTNQLIDINLTRANIKAKMKALNVDKNGEEYKEYEQKQKELVQLKNEYHELKSELDQLKKQALDVKVKMGSTKQPAKLYDAINNIEECETKINYKKAEIKQKRDELAQLNTKENHFKKYYNLKQEKKQIERERVFKGLEIAGAALLTVGVLLGTAFIFGAGTVASFGALPIALLATGCVIGLGTMAFEVIDEKFCDNKMSNWIENKWSNLKHSVRNLFGINNKNKTESKDLLSNSESNSPRIADTTGIMTVLHDNGGLTKSEPIEIKNPNSEPTLRESFVGNPTQQTISQEEYTSSRLSSESDDESLLEDHTNNTIIIEEESKNQEGKKSILSI